jgi:hypothetical protein
LTGAAAAYGLATSAAAIATYLACRSSFEIKLERGTAKTLLRALALLIAVGLTCAMLSFTIVRLFVCALLVLLWCASTLQDDAARQMLARAWRARPGRASR